MANESLSQWRRAAKRAGVAWTEVWDCYLELKRESRERAERPNAIRQAAWEAATPRGCHPFWRHGFISRWGRAVERHDYTAIPRYDELASTVAYEFPEFATDDGPERLFDFLFTPYERLPTRDDLLDAAIERAVRQRRSAAAYADSTSDGDDAGEF